MRTGMQNPRNTSTATLYRTMRFIHVFVTVQVQEPLDMSYIIKRGIIAICRD